jgi:predicted enzyme related to lactoylglutathione lyase
MKHAINWFEIPVLKFDRAKTFYEMVIGAEMQTMEAMGMKSAFFPADMESGGIGGCIISGDGYIPSKEGALVYLNGGDDLIDMLDRVESAGGKVVLPKTAIGHNGFMAYFLDTEGNRVGLHSRK